MSTSESRLSTGPWAVEQEAAPIGTDGKALSARGEATRRRLLDAAETCFATLGWEDASIVKITESAGVSIGTFYRYFDTKQAVFDELVDDLNRRVRHAMSESAARGRTRAERERLGFKGFFTFTAEHRALYRIIRQAEFASPAALHRHYDRIAAGYVDGLRAAQADGEIAADVDPEVAAWALMGIGELIGMRWTMWGETDEVPDAVLDQVVAFITRGLGGDA
ncbi:TetR/AcrR family transcriptional regulator [Euzebya sp.]|uniref:TetR/AcrR family transcriptional regulator n=1 Tax=Euzebya sp. TaxID=1971409 RepID=UPI0035139099